MFIFLLNLILLSDMHFPPAHRYFLLSPHPSRTAKKSNLYETKHFPTPHLWGPVSSVFGFSGFAHKNAKHRLPGKSCCHQRLPGLKSVYPVKIKQSERNKIKTKNVIVAPVAQLSLSQLSSL